MRPLLGTILLPLVTLALLPQATAAADAPSRPNIVLVLTDDLSGRLVEYLPRLRRMLPEKGLELGLVATTPVCAPSRASILTGQYAHNHGVQVNDGTSFRRRGTEKSTFATWLQDAGYETGYFGKYLNGYGRRGGAHLPPGWDRWLSGADSRGRFRFETVAEDGTRTRVEGQYDVDVYAAAAADFAATAREPFLAVWSPLAPHGPFLAPRRHRGRFDRVAIAWPPSFRGDRVAIARNVRTRLEMMLAVEDGTAAILRAIEERGASDRTYVFFTSDHGVFAGEHGFDAGKGQPHEETIRAPLYIRGPGVRVGRSDALVGTHDLAPTFADLAGVAVPAHVDGRSLKPLLAAEPEDGWRERLLLEFWTLDHRGSWCGLRSRDVKYARWPDGRCLLFRLDLDPDEMNALDCAGVADLERTVARLGACRGHECVLLEDEPSAGPLPGSAPGDAVPACRPAMGLPLLAERDPVVDWLARTS